MEDNLHQFFDENDFDIFEPHSGHFDRFQRKLEKPNRNNKPTIFWMSIAAYVILVIGFYLGSLQTKTVNSLRDISPKMAEAESFFINTINQELKELEQYRNIETESVIEDALDEIEELEDRYKNLTKELSKNQNKRQIIQKMIGNYQQRLQILEWLLLQLEQQKNPAKLEILDDEII